MSEQQWNDAFLDVVFDGPPGPEAGRFVEVEDPDGRSVSAGQWLRRNDGYWVLRMPHRVGTAAVASLAASILAGREGQLDAFGRLANDDNMAVSWAVKMAQEILAEVQRSTPEGSTR